MLDRASTPECADKCHRRRVNWDKLITCKTADLSLARARQRSGARGPACFGALRLITTPPLASDRTGQVAGVDPHGRVIKAMQRAERAIRRQAQPAPYAEILATLSEAAVEHQELEAAWRVQPHGNIRILKVLDDHPHGRH